MSYDSSLGDISARIATDFRDIDVQARNILKIFLCGSYEGKDKVVLLQLQSILTDPDGEFRIPGVLLMDDIPMQPSQTFPFHQKFDLIWTHIRQGDNSPLCIIYAGATASRSTGLKVEIPMVTSDPLKKQCTVLIRMEGVKLVDHADEIVNSHIVKTDEQFLEVSKQIVRAKLAEITAFLTHEREKGCLSKKE
jgi:hypothetical protein